MFDLAGAHVHYSPSSYPLDGLATKFASVADIDSLDLVALGNEVARITGHRREFTAKLCERVDIAALAAEKGLEVTGSIPAEIPERIVAQASGFTITWNKAA